MSAAVVTDILQADFLQGKYPSVNRFLFMVSCSVTKNDSESY
jgi:hypothetical protein